MQLNNIISTVIIRQLPVTLIKIWEIVTTQATIENMKISATNRKHSEKTKSKMAISKMGDNNPMFGKTRTESSKKYRGVLQLDLNKNLIKPWQGVSIASKELKINRCTISDVCNSRKKTAGGFVWKYAEQYI